MLIQQGDVLLTKVDGIDLTHMKRHNEILAEGEATGHAHRVRGGGVFASDDGGLYVQSEPGCEVVHEEHGTSVLEPGIYRVGRVLEYDHFKEEAHEVRD